MNETVLNETYEKNLSDRLLKERKIMAFGRLDEKAAEKIIASMLYLDSVGHEPITLYINSTGGFETEVLGIYDVMRHLDSPVETICAGKAHGISALLLAGGTKGRRKAYANSEVMLNQVGRDRTFGQASDIELETAHLLETKARVISLLAALCNRSEDQIHADMERKYWLYAEQAKDYGLIDQVIG